jgi:hypothetical protein
MEPSSEGGGMNDREKILARIKKCLALSRSSNEHEAAIALRQAQALMREHGISDSDVAASYASETRGRSGASRTPVDWETGLAQTVAKTIGCEVIFCSSREKGSWIFIGCNSADQICEYAFAVLHRQLKRARSEYIKKHLRRCSAARKTRRADLYCEGWVVSVASKVEPLRISETERAAIAAYAGRYLTHEMKPLCRNESIKGAAVDDWLRGRRDGNDIDLRRPIAGGEDHEALR